MISGIRKYYFEIKCDICGQVALVEKDEEHGVYNGAQAVRSFGWHYGRDKRVTCADCAKGEIRHGFIFMP